MSEIMLQGILRMPPDLWDDSELDKIQRHSAYIQAADLIDQLEAENKALKNRIQILERDDTDWTIAVRNQARKSK